MRRRRCWLTLLAYLLFFAALPSPYPLGAELHDNQAGLHQTERQQKHSDRSFGATVINPPPGEEAAETSTNENTYSDANTASKLEQYRNLIGQYLPSGQTWIAILTLGVGFGQFYLWWVTIPLTKQAADAAKESADTQREAMLTIERPHLLFENLRLFQFSPEPRKDSDPPLPFEEVKRRVETATYPSVTYRVKNYGKSPAWLTRWSVTFKSFNQLPESPIYEEQPVLGFAIPAGEGFPQETMLRPVGLSYEQRLRILNNEERLFIYGFVEYTDIFKQKSHKMGFCWRWSGPSGYFGAAGIWEPSGPESYWYYD